MKSKNRIHRNGASKAVKSQAKTPQLKLVTVIFYYEKDGRELARIELPEVLLAAVRRAVKKMKITAGRFFGLAIANKIDREISIPAMGGAR